LKYHHYFELLKNNREWAQSKITDHPEYFKKLREGQTPHFLFIGCSDSRVPVNLITKTEPGEIFIHRNIANQVQLGDMNFLSILEYAVFHLKVKHIVVKGHTSCGGVRAAMKGSTGLVENWTMPIKDLYLRNRQKLDSIQDEEERMDCLSEMNVILQVENLCKTSILHRIFREGDYPFLHGWMFELHTGEIRKVDLPLKKWVSQGLLPADYEQRLEAELNQG